jgi:hypothetical protein
MSPMQKRVIEFQSYFKEIKNTDLFIKPYSLNSILFRRTLFLEGRLAPGSPLMGFELYLYSCGQLSLDSFKLQTLIGKMVKY